MKVISKNSEHLILQKQVADLVNKIKIFFATLGFILLFFICWMIFNELTAIYTLECSRIESTQVICQINHQSSIHIEKAENKKTVTANGSNNEPIRFGYSTYMKGEIDEIVEKINMFVANSNLSSFSIEQGKNWGQVAALAMLLFIPFLIIRKMIWRSPLSIPLREKWDFDIQQHKLIITKLFEKNKTESNEYSLLGEVKVQKLNLDNEDKNINHELKIILDSGESLELYSGNNKEKAENLYNEITSFMNSNYSQVRLFISGFFIYSLLFQQITKSPLQRHYSEEN